MPILKRLHITIQGVVQGVGFRPFIYRLATELELVGWVNNFAGGVAIEVEGSQTQLQAFLLRIYKELPPHASIQNLESAYLAPIGYKQFEIRASTGGENTALILPDIATCADCLREIFDKRDRRYLYPFTNCTHCGPRFSIITALPYDRANTTMQKFEMCDRCQAEYHDPLNRRFHAQPNACGECGPHLELWQDGHVLTSHYAALQQAVEEIRKGKIVAIKGLGGFHLVVDARHQQAVTKLRYCKQREGKPFALMYPSLQLIKAHCEVSNLETQLLLSPQAPIVLLRRKSKSRTAIAPAVAPDNPYLGVMLPYTPLHHLLMSQLGFPIVATSGNLTDEPICTDEREAIHYLSNIATVFLIHNRPITRPIDDSVVRVIMEREFLLRRARGYAPLPIAINLSPIQQPQSKLLAVGAHFKNTIAFSLPQQVFVSQHIGDLATLAALKAFNQAIADFQQLYQLQPLTIACDAHPDYVSTQFAQNSGLPTIPVQHHYAHVLACMAENDLLRDENSILGIAWDGTGYGLDGTIWGGEFLQIQPMRSLASDSETPFQRVAHLRTFRLPGGEKAIKEPRRIAIGLLYEIVGNALFTMNELAPVHTFNAQELRILQTMLQRNLNTTITSSAGRLFDAIAAIIGLRQYTQFEGQAAMELEFAIAELNTDDCYSFEITTMANSPLIIDWMPTVQGVLADLSCELPQGYISAKFHNTLVEMMVVVAQQIGAKQVVLTGGCFQNKYLIERTIQRLTQEGFHTYWHQQVPPHDGGIALGQIVAALRVI